jgi:hypothetical protein
MAARRTVCNRTPQNREDETLGLHLWRNSAENARRKKAAVGLRRRGFLVHEVPEGWLA